MTLNPVRIARHVFHAHVRAPHHDRAEPVLVGSAYGVSALTFHSVIGTVVVAGAYITVATLAYVDTRRERSEHVEECYGRHATCQGNPAE
jgi:hypothetical protein